MKDQETMVIEIGPRLAYVLSLFSSRPASDAQLQKLTSDLAEGSNALKQAVEQNQPKE